MTLQVSVFGTGYVGLVTAVCLADLGHQVCAVDIDANRIERLNAGEVPIYEDGLEELLIKNLQEKRITFTAKSSLAIQSADVVFIAVGTPSQADGHVDMKQVLAVAKETGKYARGYTLVVNKSTVPVNSANLVHRCIQDALQDKEAAYEVISNPEFLREGTAVKDFMYPDRIIVGKSSARSERIIRQLYAPIVDRGHKLLFLENKNCELSKYAANAFLAMKISFINEIANLCDACGGDVEDVRLAIGSDSRIGEQFLHAGIGYGGSCFPKDVCALSYFAHTQGLPFKLLAEVEAINQRQKKLLVQKLAAVYSSLEGKRITLWGLAFKSNTDDLRDSPALDIIAELLEQKCVLRVHDSLALEHVRNLFGERLHYFNDLYEAVEGSDALLVLTDALEYRNSNPKQIHAKLAQPYVFDGRNIFSRKVMKQVGLHYVCIGRNTQHEQA